MASGLKGARELDAKLKELGAITEEKVMRAGLRSALKPVKDHAEQLAKTLNQSGKMHRTYKGRLVAPGFASRNLVIVSRRAANGKIRANLGVRNEAFYAIQFIELGTRYIRPRPWITKALSDKSGEAIDRLRTYLEKRIKQIARKRGLSK